MFTYISCNPRVALLFVQSLSLRCRSLDCARELARHCLTRTKRLGTDGLVESLEIFQEA
jgi:hypothetical protein